MPPDSLETIIRVLFLLTLGGIVALLVMCHLIPARLARWNSIPWAFQLPRAQDTDLHCTLYALYHGTRWGRVSHYLFALDVLAWFALAWSVHPLLVAALLAGLAVLAVRIGDRTLALTLGAFWAVCAALAPLLLGALDGQTMWLELAVVLQGVLRVIGHVNEPIPPLLGDGADAFRSLRQSGLGAQVPLVLAAGYVSEVTAGLPWGLIRVQAAWLVDHGRRQARHWDHALSNARRIRAGGFAAYGPTAAMLAERDDHDAGRRPSGGTS